MADFSTGFGMVNLKAQVLDTPARPGDKMGQQMQGPLESTAGLVGDDRLESGGPYGQGLVHTASNSLFVGETRPGGPNGQGTGGAGPKPKRTTVLD